MTFVITKPEQGILQRVRLFALKGRDVIAQGAALGGRPTNFEKPCKGEIIMVAPFQATAARRRRRAAFTLVELILAIALSVTLLALIGTAINLYLVRVDAGRSRVEEAQLARSILAMIADDLRATAIYKPQDTSTVASLVAASAAAFDVDSIDNPTGAGGLGGTGAPGGTSAAGTAGSATSLGAASSSASSGGTSGSVEETLPLGLNGALDELYVDTDQLPRMEELFRTNTGYTNAQSVVTATGPTAMPSTASMASASRPSNVKTVRYIVREGRSPGPESTAIASLPLDEQQEIGGLVRQQIDRPARVFADTTGDSALLESGQVLVAPEVVHIEFRYFDGSQIFDDWDMTEMGGLPLAIEVRIWLMTPEAQREKDGMPYDSAKMANDAREYRQIVYLPMSAIAGPEAGSESASGNSEASESGSEASGESASGTGSGFDS